METKIMTAIEGLIRLHKKALESNPYAYFELAYTRQTEWMAWLCSESAEVNPKRIVYAKGQGSNPETACAEAIKDCVMP